MPLHHTGCGGEIDDDPAKSYEYEGESIPAIRCKKCGREIGGDAEIAESIDDIQFGEQQ